MQAPTTGSDQLECPWDELTTFEEIQRLAMAIDGNLMGYMVADMPEQQLLADVYPRDDCNIYR